MRKDTHTVARHGLKESPEAFARVREAAAATAAIELRRGQRGWWVETASGWGYVSDETLSLASIRLIEREPITMIAWQKK